jgi:hypothetical protein
MDLLTVAIVLLFCLVVAEVCIGAWVWVGESGAQPCQANGS